LRQAQFFLNREFVDRHTNLEKRHGTGPVAINFKFVVAPREKQRWMLAIPPLKQKCIDYARKDFVSDPPRTSISFVYVKKLALLQKWTRKVCSFIVA
jgi:hypothetical protein